jgi:hypothetical protein
VRLREIQGQVNRRDARKGEGGLGEMRGKGNAGRREQARFCENDYTEARFGPITCTQAYRTRANGIPIASFEVLILFCQSTKDFAVVFDRIFTITLTR